MDRQYLLNACHGGVRFSMGRLIRGPVTSLDKDFEDCHDPGPRAHTRLSDSKIRKHESRLHVAAWSVQRVSTSRFARGVHLVATTAQAVKKDQKSFVETFIDPSLLVMMFLVLTDAC